MSYFVKARDVNWLKAGEESVLGQEAGKEVETSGWVNKARELRVSRHYQPISWGMP